ncbi:unnamed protein product [Ambrosiozyma monospora]|uniref:Unnamed protein product n=1 Tax=Ambrosiozyma monospora TaxID=43982 RepID=A0ACB5UBM8_AMBMO|nr:unnamed protein product [Ambrosiozyma monospora]
MIFPGYQLRNRRSKFATTVFGMMGTMYGSLRPYLLAMLCNFLDEFYRVPYMKLDSILFELELTEFKKRLNLVKVSSSSAGNYVFKSSVPVPVLKLGEAPKNVIEEVKK